MTADHKITADQHDALLEMLSRIFDLTNEGDFDSMPEWAVKAARQRALAGIRILQRTVKEIP